MRFIYLLRDAAGEIVYIGQTSNVARRLAEHYRAATRNPIRGAYHVTRQHRTLAWLPDVRDVEVRGPFGAGASAVERHLIEHHQPRGNHMFTLAWGGAA